MALLNFLLEDKMLLKEMFAKQHKLQIKLGNDKYKHNETFIKNMTLAAIDELMEALRETPWKPWKKQQYYNKKLFQKELIDVWHFLINLSLASGMNYNDVYNKFIYKNKINLQRKKEGY